MPSEDYYRTAMIQHIGKMLGIKTPMIDQFLTRYEASCKAYKETHEDQQLSSQFNTNLFEGDKALVTKFWKSIERFHTKGLKFYKRKKY